MTTYSPLVVGVFEQQSEAKKAVNALRDAGFTDNQIGFALREGGVVTNTLLSDFVKLGIPQDRAAYYENEYKAGHALVSVRGDGREQEAARILGTYGAYDYGQQDAYTQAGTGGYDPNRQYTEGEQYRTPVREERLGVEKQRVQSGEARIRKDVVEEQQNIDVPVTHEEVTIERRPTQEQASDIPVGQDETIRVPVSEEQVNVTKTPVETGEVAVKKHAVQEKKTVSDTVRREEPHLEKEGNPQINTNDDLTNP